MNHPSRLAFFAGLLMISSSALTFGDCFVQNKGQWPAEFLYCAEVEAGKLWVKRDSMVLQLVEAPARPEPACGYGREPPSRERRDGTLEPPEQGPPLRICNVTLCLGGSGFSRVEAEAETPTKINIFKGDDPSKWVTDIPTFKRIRMMGLGLDADLVLECGFKNGLAWYFEGEPTAQELAPPKLLIDARVPVCEENGAFIVEAPFGRRTFQAPQWVPAKNSATKESPWHDAGNAPSETQQELLWGTYLGGSTGTQTAYAVQIDLAGDVIVGGITGSSDIPVPHGYDQTYGGYYSDFYIAKLSGDGTTLLWGTYLGGSDRDGSQNVGVAIDPSGDIVIGGVTWSEDAPVPGGFDTTGPVGYHSKGYLAKLSGQGDSLLWGTFLNMLFECNVVLDSAGNAVVCGGAFYVTKVSSMGDQLLWQTPIRGTGIDECNSVALDSQDNVVIGGKTSSTDLPVPNAFDPTWNGPYEDMYIAKLSADGSLVLFGTYLGGYDYDSCQSVACDAQGDIVVGGYTWSPDIPTTPDAYDPTKNGGKDDWEMYIAKLSASGSEFLWGTFLDSPNGSNFGGIHLDSFADVFVIGNSGPGMPTPNGYQQNLSDEVGNYACKLSPGGESLLWGTYVSGSRGEMGYSIASDAQGNVVIAGTTISPDIPTPNGYDQTFNSVQDMYIAKLTNPVPPAPPGDCDGDGQVSIGEVQRAVNMFLGIEPPACGVDCDGDGSVSIGEVQKVINGFLGLLARC